MLLVRPGSRTRVLEDGSLRIVELAKSGLCLPLDMGLKFDLLVWRQAEFLKQELRAFAPDLVHITGPGDIGMLSARAAHSFRVPKAPLVASWHTNLHQYARLRAGWLLNRLPCPMARSLGERIENDALRAAGRFYRSARMTLAPNREILERLLECTKRPGAVMPHGVDTGLFRPPAVPRCGAPLTLGYVGRLTPEKNVRLLADIAARLPEPVRERVRFLVVGDGSERAWLESALPNARFTGVLSGEKLAEAYRAMDLFLFPSRSDTFGLVVLEAMATGLPVVSFRLSGPGCAVSNGVTGFTCPDEDSFHKAVTELATQAALRRQFSAAAREHAETFGWDWVFESILESYRSVLPAGHAADRVAAAALG